MNNTLFRPSRQTGACASAEHQVAEAKDSLHDQQTRLLDEADAKVRTESQARHFTLDFSWCIRQSWQNQTPRTDKKQSVHTQSRIQQSVQFL